MLKKRHGITYRRPWGEESGTRGTVAAARCSNHRLLSSSTSPDDLHAFAHLRPSDLLPPPCYSRHRLPRTYLSTLGPNMCLFFFLRFFWEASAAKTTLSQSWRRKLGHSQGEKSMIWGSGALQSQQAVVSTRSEPILAIRAAPTCRIYIQPRAGSCWS